MKGTMMSDDTRELGAFLKLLLPFPSNLCESLSDYMRAISILHPHIAYPCLGLYQCWVDI
jgi:hypothetical protein